jgi:Carboxypeptidase regulatory-like domain
MRWSKKSAELGLLWLITLSLLVTPLYAQKQTGGIRGRVTDDLGGLITQAKITVTNSTGVKRTIVTNSDGMYTLSGLEPGNYILQVESKGFAHFESESVEVQGGRLQELNITLRVTIADQKVTVNEEAAVNTDADNNGTGIVLKGRDLDSLPDDPDGLLAALQAMAGPAAGPSGTQVYVDGFTANDRLPPKASIKEVRINLNPFSSEFDRLGFGRIEITTRPGSEEFHGLGEFFFNTDRFNSRNPFASQRAPYGAQYYYGSLSGPLIHKRATFFAAMQIRDVLDNSIINATVLDPAMKIIRFSEAVETPRREMFTSISADYKLKENHSFTFNYRYLPTRWTNIGIGEFSLSSRAYDLEHSDHNFRMTEISVLNSKVVNETRFQYLRAHRELKDSNASPSIRVLEAFNGGGAQVGNSFFNEDRWEVHNYTTSTLGAHVFRAGARLRGVRVDNVSLSNFGGTYSFAGGLAPRLDGNDQLVLDANDRPINDIITSIERYRRTLVFQQAQLSPAEIRALGGGATQLSIAGGNPKATVSRIDAGFFVQNDWRARPNLLLSAGLRFESQNNISSKMDFGPRVSFAWSPPARGKEQSKTVIRGGFGIFFDRISEGLTLQANRFNGTNQQLFVTTDPSILNLFPFVPATDTLTNFAVPQTIVRMSDQLRSPYTIQTALSVERQLPYKTTLSVSFVNTRTLHLLRSRNINAPFADVTGQPLSGSPRPDPDSGNIFQYESNGVFNQRQFVVNVANRFNNRFSFYGIYSFNKADSDTDGSLNFPANSYDLRDEYGRSSLDMRHRFVFGGTFTAPWNVVVSPFIVVRSGVPFNITTGRDNNLDAQFTDRPAFATNLNGPDVVVTRFGAFNLNPGLGDQIIPRNFGNGPGFSGVNLRLEKTFAFGSSPKSKAANGRGPAAERPYKLSAAISVQNLFNHTNFGSPIGNLSSELFGLSNTTSSEGAFGTATSNRRINFILRFNF